MKLLFSLECIDSLNIFGNKQNINQEIADLLLYTWLLNNSKDNLVFGKLTKVVWDEIKDAQGISEYVPDVVTSIKSLSSLILNLAPVLGFT